MMKYGSYENIASEEDYHAGQIIFKEGSSGDWVYVVLSGSVEVSKVIDGKKSILGVLEPGEIFGELALMGNIKRTATARAIGETTVGIIDRDFLDNEFNKLSSNFRTMLISFVHRYSNVMDRARNFAIRKDERVNESLSLKFKDHRAFLKACTENVSRGGLFIRTANPLEVGQRFPRASDTRYSRIFTDHVSCGMDKEAS
jgi:CRP/FNR family cyclic AMP-dependent transcriptional regulator